MKNLSIKTFFTFLLLSLLIMGAVYSCLYFFTPYAGADKYLAYIEDEAKTLSDKCMGMEKASAEKLIYDFAGRTGASAELVNSQTVRNMDTDALSYPLRFADQPDEYVLYVTCTSERTVAFWSSIGKSLPVVFVLALILAFVGARIFSHYMKKPIVRMSRIAERMAEQDFGWYCPEERDDEIGVLAKSLNKLSDELSAALNRLNDKNLYLKNEIALEKERERRRMLFFSGVSHELKTPISVVIGQIDGMRAGIGVYKDRDKYLEKCSATLNELVAFINEILLVSHIDMGDIDEAESVEIDGILDGAIAFYDELLTEKGLELEYEVPDHVSVRGNENLMEKAIGNIIGNAVKYTPDGGTIRVELTPTANAEKTSLTVTNSPAHVDEQHLPHLFEAFYRADADGSEGSGLGLYITGMVLEMFGAEYRVENIDDGVRFTVNFT